MITHTNGGGEKYLTTNKLERMLAEMKAAEKHASDSDRHRIYAAVIECDLTADEAIEAIRNYKKHSKHPKHPKSHPLFSIHHLMNIILMKRRGLRARSWLVLIDIC